MEGSKYRPVPLPDIKVGDLVVYVRLKRVVDSLRYEWVLGRPTLSQVTRVTPKQFTVDSTAFSKEKARSSYGSHVVRVTPEIIDECNAINVERDRKVADLKARTTDREEWRLANSIQGVGVERLAAMPIDKLRELHALLFGPENVLKEMTENHARIQALGRLGGA